jgi:hypothetical protein
VTRSIGRMLKWRMILLHGSSQEQKESKKINAKTYNSGDSLVVTHLTTNPPVSCLNRAERTGSLVLKILWSYVEEMARYREYEGGRGGGR